MQSSTAYQYPTEFPGFGKPVNGEPPGAYRSALSDDSLRCAQFQASFYCVKLRRCSLLAITLSERWMLQFMNVVTDKPEWFNKVHPDLDLDSRISILAQPSGY